MSGEPISARGGQALSADAVVFEKPRVLSLRRLDLFPSGPSGAPGDDQVVVDVEWSGISTGTEKLLWTGRMPDFPGMGYPLVPGYETIGRVRSVGRHAGLAVGDRVFVAGARCYGDVRGLFGGAASRLVTDADKVVPLAAALEADGVLLALAATAHHALMLAGRPALPEVIVGHGVLGRLLARLTIALGGDAPQVWETDPARHGGAEGYEVIDPRAAAGQGHRRILDASGDPGIIDQLVPSLARHGEIVLAGFYGAPLSFQFPPAFMREARMRIAAEWLPEDLQAVNGLAASGALSLSGLVSHTLPAAEANAAYPLAFDDPGCLKMVLDWRSH